MQSRWLEAHLYWNSFGCLKRLCNVSILPPEYILYCEQSKVAFLYVKVRSEYVRFKDTGFLFQDKTWEASGCDVAFPYTCLFRQLHLDSELCHKSCHKIQGALGARILPFRSAAHSPLSTTTAPRITEVFFFLTWIQPGKPQTSLVLLLQFRMYFLFAKSFLLHKHMLFLSSQVTKGQKSTLAKKNMQIYVSGSAHPNIFCS